MADWPARVNEAEIRQLGLSLRRIDAGLMKAGARSDGQRVWYQGREPYFDLVLETDAQGLRWWQLTLRGKVLLWHRDSQRIQTGETEELDVPPMLAYYAASKAIRDDAELDYSFVRLVQKILRTRHQDALLSTMADILEAV